jgi:carbamoyltransferase
MMIIFPKKAIAYCLREAGITIDEVDYIAFYEKPFLKFERILETYLTHAPYGINSFLKAMPVWLKKKLWMKEDIRRIPDLKERSFFLSIMNHMPLQHFFPSPFKRRHFLHSMVWVRRRLRATELERVMRYRLLAEMDFPHSLGCSIRLSPTTRVLK